MSDKPWKAEERRAAALCGGTRFPANGGGPVDFESPGYVGQVKHVKRLSLATLEELAVEVERIGAAKAKVGVVVVKRRAGRGQPTPRLIVMIEAAWRGAQFNPPFPLSGDEPEGIPRAGSSKCVSA